MLGESLQGIKQASQQPIKIYFLNLRVICASLCTAVSPDFLSVAANFEEDCLDRDSKSIHISQIKIVSI